MIYRIPRKGSGRVTEEILDELSDIVSLPFTIGIYFFYLLSLSNDFNKGLKKN